MVHTRNQSTFKSQFTNTISTPLTLDLEEDSPSPSSSSSSSPPPSTHSHFRNHLLGPLGRAALFPKMGDNLELSLGCKPSHSHPLPSPKPRRFLGDLNSSPTMSEDDEPPSNLANAEICPTSTLEASSPAITEVLSSPSQSSDTMSKSALNTNVAANSTDCGQNPTMLGVNFSDDTPINPPAGIEGEAPPDSIEDAGRKGEDIPSEDATYSNPDCYPHARGVVFCLQAIAGSFAIPVGPSVGSSSPTLSAVVEQPTHVSN